MNYDHASRFLLGSSIVDYFSSTWLSLVVRNRVKEGVSVGDKLSFPRKK